MVCAIESESAAAAEFPDGRRSCCCYADHRLGASSLDDANAKTSCRYCFCEPQTLVVEMIRSTGGADEEEEDRNDLLIYAEA